MFYYDVKEADDRRPRRYVYSVCPEDASCISLDFRLIQSDREVDFIRVYNGKDLQSPLLGTLGAKSGGLLLQSDGGCLTFEFIRDADGLNSVWTAVWQSDQEGDCIDPALRPDECENVQEICGPRYHESFRYHGRGQKQELQNQSNCLAEETNSIWYKFKARKDGQLNFRIVPDNAYDDLDWVLWRGSELPAESCPEIVQKDAERLACNFAAGRGPKGSTGMNAKGHRLQNDAAGSPFSSSIEVEKGEVFYLLLDNHSQRNSGFSIEFNDVVLQCGGQDKALIHFAHKAVKKPSRILPRDQFSRYTQVLRVPLDQKINDPLAVCSLNSAALETAFPSGDKARVSILPGSQGLVMALINALRTSSVKAYAAEDLRTPVHFGDLLEMAYRFAEEPPQWSRDEVDPVFGPSGENYWNPSPDVFMNFCNVVEIIQDEIFDKQRGQNRREIRYIRLVWSDWEGELPDYNVCVFPYEEVEALLDQISLPTAQNDIHQQSLKDALESGQYHGFPVTVRSKNFRNAPDGQSEAFRQLEFRNYHWDQ